MSTTDVWRRVFAGDDVAAGTTTLHNDLVSARHRNQGKPIAAYLEPNLVSMGGHPYNLARHYCRWLIENNFHAVVLHGENGTFKGHTDWHRYFRTPHHTMALKPISSSDELEKVEAFYAREFSAAIEPLAAEICLYPTIRYTNIVSAVRAAMECSTRPAVYCGVMEAGDVPDCKDSALVHDAFGRASTLLQRNGVKHLLVAETEPVRDFLLQAGFGAEQVKIHPYIAARSIDQGMVNKRASGPLKVGYLGGTRATRSPELVAKLIIEQAAHQDIRWVVQMDLDFLSKRHGSDLVGGLNRLAASGIIELLPSGIDENRYQDVFRSLDLLVMPYSSRYRVIGSGLLIEAIYAGVIPILPADGHMISLYQELGGSPGRIESLTVASLNRAVQEAVGSYSDRSAMVEAVRQAWQHHPWSSESWASTFGTWLGQGADQPTSGGV